MVLGKENGIGKTYVAVPAMAIFINNSSLLYNDSLYPIILFPAERGNSGGAGDRKLWMKSFLLGVGTVVVHLDRKLYAKSFLLSVGTMWFIETGNY